MKVQVIYKDGSAGEIPCVRYHPGFERHVDQFGTVSEPEGLWVTEDDVYEHLLRTNGFRRRNGIPEREFDKRTCADLIDFAAAPFRVYVRTDDGEPWRHNGTLVKTVRYGGGDTFWKTV